jgi:hypothetical protein
MSLDLMFIEPLCERPDGKTSMNLKHLNKPPAQRDNPNSCLQFAIV